MLPDPTLSCAPASPPPPSTRSQRRSPAPHTRGNPIALSPPRCAGSGRGGGGGTPRIGAERRTVCRPRPRSAQYRCGMRPAMSPRLQPCGMGGGVEGGVGGWEEAANICWKGQSGKVCRAAGRGPDRAGWGGESSAPTPPPPPSQRCSCAGAQRGVGAAGRGWGRGETEARGAGMRFGVKPGSHAHPTCVGSGQGARSGFIAVRDTAPPGMGEELRGGWERAQRSPPPQRRSLPSLPPHPHPPAGGWSRTVGMETGKHGLPG